MPVVAAHRSPAALEVLRAEALTCTRCALAAGRTQVVFGTGNPAADLMFVGEGPGRDEDLAGEPFVGRSGKLLDRLMAEELGIDRTQCYIANVVKCRPPENRDPRPEEIEACRPYLARQVELIAPTVVVTLGNFATRLLLETAEGISRLRGRAYPFGGGYLVPTYHPAAALRSGGELLAEMRADFVRAKSLVPAGPA
jgi:DNA polymerase